MVEIGERVLLSTEERLIAKPTDIAKPTESKSLELKKEENGETNARPEKTTNSN